MKVLVVLRDVADGRVDLIKLEDGRYVFRQWKMPLGSSICVVNEIRLEEHEVMQLLQVLIDEVEEWRKKDIA